MNPDSHKKIQFYTTEVREAEHLQSCKRNWPNQRATHFRDGAI